MLGTIYCAAKTMSSMIGNILYSNILYGKILYNIIYSNPVLSQNNVFSRRRSFQIFGNHRLALPHPVHFALSHDDDDQNFATSVHMIIDVNSAPETRCGVQSFLSQPVDQMTIGINSDQKNTVESSEF